MPRDVSKRLTELFSLENKVALITGGGGAIGGEMAKALSQVGAAVALADRDLSGMQAVAEAIMTDGGDALVIETDLLQLSSIHNCVEKAVERFGKIDILINCAGINKRMGCLNADEETFDRIIGVNLKGMYFMSQEVAKHMIRQKNGSIINICSYNAVMMLGGNGIYGASKSGVAAITRAQAIEWAKYGIRSNAISPGHISTPLTAPLWTDPVRSKYMLDRIAMARPGTPQDLIGMTILLASDASSYMSGMLYHVDGGCLAGGQPWEIDPPK
jgi:NAD(P)-dependent dehydrogenase (short-subunit alcohol dehydrogenase family)